MQRVPATSALIVVCVIALAGCTRPSAPSDDGDAPDPVEEPTSEQSDEPDDGADEMSGYGCT
ncbi:MAG: hypothetical protein WD011_02415 [Nitriliruptoraceae bacterium]